MRLFSISIMLKCNGRQYDIGGNALAPKSDFKILSNYYLDKIDPDKWVLKSDSLTTQQFTAKISESNPYQILIQSDFVEGKKYQLTIPKETVSSFYAKNTQSKRFDFEADKVENYGSVAFEIENAPTSNYWIQLLDSSEKVVYQKYTKGNKVKFDILKPAEYIVRILVDNNNNKYWDEADFLNEVFAEESFVFYKAVIIRPLWDTNENWDLKDTRTLDKPKGPTSAKPSDPAQEKPVKQDANNREIKSDNAILTPVK